MDAVFNTLLQIEAVYCWNTGFGSGSLNSEDSGALALQIFVHQRARSCVKIQAKVGEIAKPIVQKINK